MKFEVQRQMAEDLVNDVLNFFEKYTLEDLKYVPEIDEENGQETPYDKLTNEFMATISGYIKED